MDKKRFFIYLASLVFFIFILNTLAGRFYWYYSIWYFDIIMHFLGGIWLGLVFIWLFWGKEFNLKLFLKIILGVLLISVLWEIFEIIFNNILAGDPFNFLDTTSDVFCDLAGGTFAIFYFSKRIMFKEKNKI